MVSTYGKDQIPKTGFFKDEDIKELPYEARLFYQGLWVQADREGRGEDRPERLKIEIMPYDEVDAEKVMQLLACPKKNGKRPFIVRYEIDGEKYYQIINWQKHQKPHKTERDSVIPPAPKELLTVRQPLTNGYATNISVGNGMGDGDGEGNGEEIVNKQAEPAGAVSLKTKEILMWYTARDSIFTSSSINSGRTRIGARTRASRMRS